MCAELGASKEKKSIIKGHHTYDSLITHLDKFIEKYLLCKRCKYPETTLYITKQRQLMGRCRACSTVNTLDGMHKAGAYLIKEMPKNMDEIGGNPAGEDEPAVKEQEEEDGKDEEPDHIAIDSEDFLEKLDKISSMAIGGESNDAIIEEIRRQTISLNLTKEYKYYILMCGLFNIGRSPLKNFKKHEVIFRAYLEKDGEKGNKHFFQAVILFFVRRFPDLQDQACALLKYLYDKDFFSQDFIIDWHQKKAKMDKHCVLYDRKAEKKFRETCAKFVQWLQEAEEDSSSSDDDEDNKEESKKEAKQETEAEKKQREMQERIQAQQKEQERLIVEKQEAQKKMEEMKVSEKAAQDASLVPDDKVDVGNIEVEDDFDVDDI
jgi:translation initiation factor 5